MKCPTDRTELVTARRDGLEVDECPSCRGMWLSREELDELEDKAFSLGDEEKGTMVFRSEPSQRLCPQCETPLRSFSYRLYDLELEFCPEGHGYWLDAEEDKRVLDLMKEEKARVRRSDEAEDGFAALKRRLRSGSILDRLRSLFD